MQKRIQVIKSLIKYPNNIHEKNMQSDWLREVQIFGNTVQQRGN